MTAVSARSNSRACSTGAENPGGAQAWIDFMASAEFQSDMPLNMFVLPGEP